MKHHAERAAEHLAQARANAIAPRKGLFVLVNDDRKTAPFGSGWRAMLVISCGPKWVKLFYAPNLSTMKLTHEEWVLLRPEEYHPNLHYLAHYIADHAALMDMLHMEYNHADYEIAATIIIEGITSNAKISNSVDVSSDNAVKRDSGNIIKKGRPKRAMDTVPGHSFHSNSSVSTHMKGKGDETKPRQRSPGKAGRAMVASAKRVSKRRAPRRLKGAA